MIPCHFFVRYVPAAGVTAMRSVGFRRFVAEDSDSQVPSDVWVQPALFSGELTGITDQQAILDWLMHNVGPGQIFETGCWGRGEE